MLFLNISGYTEYSMLLYITTNIVNDNVSWITRISNASVIPFAVIFGISIMQRVRNGLFNIRVLKLSKIDRRALPRKLFARDSLWSKINVRVVRGKECFSKKKEKTKDFNILRLSIDISWIINSPLEITSIQTLVIGKIWILNNFFRNCNDFYMGI